jgi:hypothetical protein
MFDQSKKKNEFLITISPKMKYWFTWKSCVFGLAICTAGIFLISFPNFSATSEIEHNVNVNASIKPASATECRIRSDTRLSSN